MKQVRFLLSGRVQGVGFRQFVKYHALRLGLRGFVRNLANGSVEAVCQGEQKRLEALAKILEKGTPLSNVEHMEVTWQSKEKLFTDFVIEKSLF